MGHCVALQGTSRVLYCLQASRLAGSTHSSAQSATESCNDATDAASLLRVLFMSSMAICQLFITANLQRLL